MKEAKKMQADLEKTQTEIAAKDFEASAGGGAIEVKVSGAKIIKEIKNLRDNIQNMYAGYESKSKDDKRIVVQNVHLIRQKCVDVISNKTFNEVELYLLLKEIDKDKNKGYARTIFDTLFATGNNTLYEIIRDNSEIRYKLSKKANENSIILFDNIYFKQKIV